MLGTRLRELLAIRGISVNDFAEICDLPIETVKNVYYGKSNDPKISTVMKMAQALNLSVNCLMGQCQHTTAEKMLLTHYRQCGNHGKSMILNVARYEAYTARHEDKQCDKHKVSCLIARGNIHEGIDYDTCERIEMETSCKESYMAVRLTTNELVPAFCRDDTLLLADRIPNNGEYAFFLRDGKAYLRQLIENNDFYMLHCIHGKCKDIVLRRMDEVEFVGTVTGVVRK